MKFITLVVTMFSLFIIQTSWSFDCKQLSKALYACYVFEKIPTNQKFHINKHVWLQHSESEVTIYQGNKTKFQTNFNNNKVIPNEKLTSLEYNPHTQKLRATMSTYKTTDDTVTPERTKQTIVEYRLSFTTKNKLKTIEICNIDFKPVSSTLLEKI